MIRALAACLVLILAQGVFLSAAAAKTDRVTAKVGSTVKSRGGVRIKFLQVIDDSRCPADTTCVWAGKADIRVELSNKRGGAKKVVTLSTSGTEGDAVYAGYRIRLIGLTPEPRTNIRIDPSGYRATFDLEKAVPR